MTYAHFFKYILLLVMSLAVTASAYEKSPPFSLKSLEKTTIKVNGKKMTAYNPKNTYSAFVNYELGMHCVGFDMSYCCVIPPYNSIQAQAIKTGQNGDLPTHLSHDDVKLFYYTKDNSYSEGNKMKYWNVLKDVDGNGRMDDSGDNLANYVWKHLFIYKDLEGTVPKGSTADKRLYVGEQIKVNIDSGPTGQHMAGGYLEYAGKHGGNIVLTDTLVPPVKDLPIVLTASHVWDALGLPMTAFLDSTRTKTLRSVTQKDFQPFQKSVVQIHNKAGKALVGKDGKIVEYFGTSPVDIPNCYSCHSREGVAAKMARDEGLKAGDAEYNYWIKNFPDISEYMARLSEGSINILDLHDKHHGTTFLSDYNSKASTNRLGQVGAVNCADCHGDNVSGNLKEPRRGVTGYKAVKAKPMTEAIHGFHLGLVGLPDGGGRSQSCQTCHPTHWQNANLNTNSNPFKVADEFGAGSFTDGDLRVGGAGCYLRRDAHTNPNAKPPFFLNEVGKYYLNEISMKDEKGKPSKEMRGLYCTNCHNHLSQALYKADNFKNVAEHKGETLRNKSLKEIIKGVAGGDKKKFKDFYADPKTTSKGDPLTTYYTKHEPATLVKNVGKDGKLDLKPWNHPKGGDVPYNAASAGSDWWLAASEPQCADCHLAPFVESEGGKYFPIDQPSKHSLFRYSKAHGKLACQSCHESAHGMYPVREDGPDQTTHQQALQYSPDGEYAGPVTCSACHTVNKKGVPVQLEGTKYSDDYWASVTLIHYMREGDQKLSLKELLGKYPYKQSSDVVKKGWK